MSLKLKSIARDKVLCLKNGVLIFDLDAILMLLKRDDGYYQP